MRRRRSRPSAVSRGRKRQGVGRTGVLDDLIDAADAASLAGLVRRLASTAPEVETVCLDYLREHAGRTSTARTAAAAGAVQTLWSTIQPDLAELDDYGGGDYDTQDRVGELLCDLGKRLHQHPIPRDDRRALLDEVLPYIQSGSAGMDDALYDVAYTACYDEADLRDLAERFEALEQDWPLDNARRIYRRLGDRESYLRLRRERMQYGADYHDLATFFWEQGERDEGLSIAREGLKNAEGRMNELRDFLAKQAKATGDRDEYLELQFAQATDCLTLAGYKAFRKRCTTQEWTRYQPRMVRAIEKAWKEDQLQLRMHRKEYDLALKILTGMNYPDERYGPSELLQVAAKLEGRYPEEILAFYLSGLPDTYFNPKRSTYARWAQAARRARHMWLNVLETPAEWEAFAKQLKSANARRPAFQQEFAKVVPGWSQL